MALKELIHDLVVERDGVLFFEKVFQVLKMWFHFVTLLSRILRSSWMQMKGKSMGQVHEGSLVPSEMIGKVQGCRAKWKPNF